jgi:hypothetical protein
MWDTLLPCPPLLLSPPLDWSQLSQHHIIRGAATPGTPATPDTPDTPTAADASSRLEGDDGEDINVDPEAPLAGGGEETGRGGERAREDNHPPLAPLPPGLLLLPRDGLPLPPPLGLTVDGVVQEDTSDGGVQALVGINTLVAAPLVVGVRGVGADAGG